MAYADLYDVNKVAIGNAMGYIQPYDADTPAALPADTLALWDPWLTPWITLGGTEEGFQLTPDVTVERHQIEEQATAVATGVTAKNISVAASLAEDSLENMAYYLGGTIAVGTVPAPDILTVSDELDFYALGLELKNYHGLARRILIPKVTITSGGALSWRRAAAKRLYPVTFNAECKPSDIQVKDYKPA